MQQTVVTIDPSVCHAKLKSDRTLCGLAYFDDQRSQKGIVQESLEYFRLMTFFKNYNYEGPSDILLIYLWVVAAHMIKTIENDQDQQAAAKKLDEIAREAITTRSGDKKNFLGGLLKEIPGETDKIQAYLKGLKDILAKEIIAKFFKEGKRTFDSKFWTGIAKRKFMGLSYTGL
ncbi:unnamed protein product [Paramecium sonneborni]|uniref:Uncharacterized protein n=1 Tax=Paramecium sonneborni TaxID=65129 RepID=A0A8S1L3V5_9CILI|nr:unnamed protein product [Paramecium sonneborni]